MSNATNQETGKKLKAKDFIGKEISAQIVENTAEGTKVADIKTKIVRIVDDSEDAEESNSYMPAKQLEEFLKENGFYQNSLLHAFGAQRSSQD